MKIYDNGVYRDMTAEEIEAYKAASAELEEIPTDALTEMITQLSTATTLAQMRAAAKDFLEKSGG